MGVFTFNNLLSAVKMNGLSETFLPPMILNISITASVIILFVLLARLALKKAPKIFSYALWAVVLFRLLCPVSITTDFSLLGLFETPAMENTQHTTAVEYIPYDVVHTPNLEVQLPLPPAINDAVNRTLPQEHAALGADPLEGEFAIGSLIWLLGIAAMAIYSAVSYIRLRRKLVGSVLLRDNIYLADGIGSPFVMGFIRPKIYLPSALSEQEQSYIILHEQHHIRRGDHIVKALAFIALCIHWFNPLVWVAFVLSSKDMEMSCDEAVVKKLGEGIRADYSASLLSLATGRRIIAGTPLAFGEGDTKSRIKNMLNWKKPALWITVLATVVCIVVLAVCGTNAASRTWIHLEEKSTESGAPRYTWNLEQPIQSWAIYEDVYSDGRLISSAARISDSFVDNGGASGRNDSFFLDVTPIFAANDDGFVNELKVVYSGAGTIEWTLLLPHSHYSASAGHNHLLREPFDSRNRFKLENNDEIILYSQLFSTAEDGSIYVDDLKNDAVVQYRLVTSTAPLQEFCRQDRALDLYELRIPILQSPELARPLVERLGVNEWGTYTLDRWSDANSSGLLIAFENTPKDEDALMRQMHPVVYLLTALIGDIDGVHYSFPRGEEQQELITVYDTHDADRYAEAIGFKNLKMVACSPVGIRMLIDYLGWTGGSAESEPMGNYGTAQDASYYLELAAGETFQDMGLEKRVSLLVEYEDLLDDYTLIARESTDGKTAYIVGQYNGNPLESPLYGMYSIDMYTGEDDYFRFLYGEDEVETVEAVVAANKTEFPPSAGYRIEDSLISWTDNSGVILIQPKENTLLLDVPWNRYFYTPNGREYMVDAISRGIDICGRTDTFLYIYRFDQRFGNIAERIALTEAEAQAILAEERVTLPEGFGFSATLHMNGEAKHFYVDGENKYYDPPREGIPRSVLDLAVEKCGYTFASPSDMKGSILSARLDCDWLDTPLYAEDTDLPRLKEILTNAEFALVRGHDYGARLTLSLSGGKTLVLFKDSDGFDTIVFGSYGGYFLGEEENIEFWEMFGLDPDTKERKEDLFFRQTGIQEADAQEFYAEFVSFIESSNKTAVLEKILYPVSVTVDKGIVVANNPEELLPHYDAIFTDGLRESIRAGQLGEGCADLFTNDGLIGAANGAIWFAGTQGVMTIQNPEGQNVRPVVSGITAEGDAAGTTIQLSAAEHDAAVSAIFANLRTDWWNGQQAKKCAYESAAFECLHREVNGNVVNLYGYGGYFRWDRNNTCVEYWDAPTIVTFDTETQQVLDLWWPGDGAAYESSILDKFPEEIASTVAEPNPDRSITVRNSLMEASKESIVASDSLAATGTTRRFGAQGLRLEISNVLSTHKTWMLAEGIEPHEYVVVSCTPESKITVLDAGMSDPTYAEDGKPHPQWGLLYTDETERTRITDETGTVPVTSDLEGIYNLEASLFVIQLNLVD